MVFNPFIKNVRKQCEFSTVNQIDNKEYEGIPDQSPSVHLDKSIIKFTDIESSNPNPMFEFVNNYSATPLRKAEV